MNEALIQSSIRQQELTDEAQRTSRALRESSAELQGQLTETELLRRLSAEMVQGDAGVLYGKIVDTAVALMHSDFASMQMFHPERGENGALGLLAHRGFTPEAARAWQWMSADHGTTCGIAHSTGLRTVVADVDECAFLGGTESIGIYRQTGIRSIQSTPLVSRVGKPLGVLSTHWRIPHEPGAHALHLFDLLARQAADLIDRRLADAALRASEGEARRLLDLVRSTTTSMAEGLYTVDAEGRATSVNPEAERLLGWQTDELIGCVMHDVMHYKHPDGSPFPADECAGLQVLRTGKALKECEDAFVKKDGSSVPVSYSCAPFRDQHGAIVGLVVVFQDISERKRARLELKRAAEELADVSRRKDEFLAMLGHELRNPLAPICAAVHLMRTQSSSSASLVEQHAREIIERQVGNLTKIVSDLLDVSRVVSGRIRLDMQVVALEQVVMHAVEATHDIMEQRKHNLRLSLCPEALWVNGDATRLDEVLVNLLNNAAKYTPDGGHIEVHCERVSGSGDAQVRVRDDGLGIDEDLLRDGRIFELFTQADRSLARSAGGLGIGLSLVQRLVRLHEGTVEVESPPKGATKGSEFTVRLPLTTPPERSSAGDPEAPASTVKGMRVLVVDDNLDLVTILGTLLRQVGHSVMCASSGPEGLRAAQQWKPDVVLLDIGLPGIDGYEVATRLRADRVQSETGATMRLIAITGYGQHADLALAREVGFDAHLTKPVEFDDLERVLAAIARNASSLPDVG